jgi:hypothetical protein
MKHDGAGTQRVTTSKTLSANNTTANIPIFRILGHVKIKKLYGVVTTIIGANHTGAFFRLNDQSAQVNLTDNAVGGTLSAAAVGSIITRTALAATVATVKTSAAGRLTESATAGIPVNAEFDIIAKNGANTDIEYSYATTDTPTSGAIQFFCEYEPLSSGASVIPQ